MTAHEIHALSGAYAVDALDDIERARFEAHLSACAECQTEVASLQAAATLFSTIAEATPPAALRNKVLAEIRTVRPLPPVAVKIIDAAPPRHRWRSLVAAAAVLTVLGGAGVTVWQQSHGSTSAVRLSAAEQALKQVVNASDVQRVTKDLPGGASASVVRSRSQGKAVLVTQNMPTPPTGRIYELWLQNQAGIMVPAGLMTGGNQTVLLTGDSARAAAVGITVEPAAGSSTPTTAPVALLDFERAT